MTEAEWQAGTDPLPMQKFLGEKLSDRKLRLLTVAYVRKSWGKLGIEEDISPYWMALDVGENYADGKASDLDLQNAKAVVRAAKQSNQSVLSLLRTYADAVTDRKVSDPFVVSTAKEFPDSPFGFEPLVVLLGCSERCELFRDMFGNPFRAVALDRSWLTATVLALAHGIYSDKAFDRMPILADALQDAGCDSEDVLDHCRQPGEHVRGCWVLDLLMGRT